jgi:hypothetical protein
MKGTFTFKVLSVACGGMTRWMGKFRRESKKRWTRAPLSGSCTATASSPSPSPSLLLLLLPARSTSIASPAPALCAAAAASAYTAACGFM